jgi:dihydroorotate dehydrogenase electron transfer subunit
MVFQESSVKQIRPIAKDIYLVKFSSAAIAAAAQPGQFVMVRPARFSEPLLPRPFSIHRIQGDYVELLFKVVGQGTRQLAGLKKGDLLEVRGPLGRGFALTKEQDPVLVAGGMGVAPLLFLAETWKKSQNKNQKKALRLFIGARTESGLLRLQKFRKAGIDVFATTEDGSFGRRGLVMELLAEGIPNPSPHQIVLACGPNPMLKAVRNWAVQKGIACQISLETRMACGLGACLGCVVARKTETGPVYVNVCQEGPVFEANEVVWDE